MNPAANKPVAPQARSPEDDDVLPVLGDLLGEQPAQLRGHGWVPCGLVYSMLALALASGSPAGGAAVLFAFGLGTLPSMLAAGFAAQRLLSFRRNDWVRRGAGLAINRPRVGKPGPHARRLRPPHRRLALHERLNPVSDTVQPVPSLLP